LRGNERLPGPGGKWESGGFPEAAAQWELGEEGGYMIAA
jgi:hypothetical protein